MAGAPRTTTPDKEEVDRLGEALVKWATEETSEEEPLRSRFCEWYTLPEIGMIKKQWDALVKLDQFRSYYERAQAALGRRFIDGTINPSIGHRLMWHYVPESADQEKEKMKYQAELGVISSTLAPNQTVIDQAAMIMKQQNEIEQLKAQLNASKCETGQKLYGSDSSI